MKMNQSDDDIFGRNIDQLDRETPRYNLSEEEGGANEDGSETTDTENKPVKHKKTKIIEKKTPSVASVQPYSPSANQPKTVMSPHPVKKGMTSSDEIISHPHVAAHQYYNPHYPMSSPNVYPTMQSINYSSARPHLDQNGPRPAAPSSLRQPVPQIHGQMGMPRNMHPHPMITNPDHPPVMRPPMEHPGGMHTSMDQQAHIRPPTSAMSHSKIHMEGAGPRIQTPFMNQLMQGHPRMMGAPPPQDQHMPCYCPDCIHPPPPPQQMSQQMMINSERQKIEDEILLRQRELDSCWQEDELDCPRDFTADDRKKEHFYAKRRGDPGNDDQEVLKSRETKTSAVPTSAYPTAVSRNTHPSSNNPGNYSGAPIMKTKAKAVVSPFSRSAPQKKVNINEVVSQFSYSNEPDSIQDYTANGWPQSEMGSRIPSTERINLSPLCMSAVQSGIQTPVDPESGQKPIAHQQQAPPVSSTQQQQQQTAQPTATNLRQLPGHQEKKNVLDTFKGNEQYNRPRMTPSQQADSVKDYTSSSWPQSEMGSRIPSSERINLSPLTMSGFNSAMQSGLQTPAEANTGAIPLQQAQQQQSHKLQDINPNNASSQSNSLERKTSTGPVLSTTNTNGHQVQVETPDPTPQQDAIQDYSMFQQSELSSRIPSEERICLSPLCQSELPSEKGTSQDIDVKNQGRQSPVDEPNEAVEAPPAPIVNENGVTLRPKKEKKPSAEDAKLNDIMQRMNLHEGRVPRFDHQQDYSTQNYARPEESSRMQSYENLVFTPSWSANTSGLVTPCDHSSLYGGAKPLRQQPVIEESENVLETDGLPERESSDNSEANVRFSETLTSSVSATKPYLAINGEPVSETSKLEPQHQQHQSTNQKRRNSWSSNGSTASNISTVVNASHSIHNTAPGSPDPDRSEDEESIISDPVISDTNVDEPFSIPSSPPPPQRSEEPPAIRKPTLFAPQRRWAPKNAVQGGPRNIPVHTYPDNTSKEPQQDPHHPPVDEKMKKMIQLAKESFPKKSNLRNTETTYQDFNRNEPPAHHQMHEYDQPAGYPDYRYGPRFQHNQRQQHMYTGNYQQNFHGHPSRDQGYPPQQYAYGNHVRPSVDMHQQHGFHMTNLHPRMPMHPSFPPPRMHSIPEQRDISQQQKQQQQQQQAVQMNNQQRMAYPTTHNQMAAPTTDPRPINHTNRMEQPTHFQHQTSGQLPPTVPGQRVFMNPTENNRTRPADKQQTVADAPYDREQRTISITSLEPNRASPPQNEGLDTISVVSFASMAASNQNIDTKADMMSSLLSMLGTHDPDDMARTLLAMSSSPDSCAAMRQSDCIPLLINLIHNEEYHVNGFNWGARQRAGKALHNIVESKTTDRRGKREVRVLRLLEIIRTHSEAILSKNDQTYRANRTAPPLREHGPGPAVAAIMKLSFEEEHKNTICELGGLQTVGEILAVDFMENMDCRDPYAIALRKYAGMVLINLTYNDAKNKSVLCSMLNALNAIIGQLRFTEEEDLVQVFAGIIRNISWRPDEKTQIALQKVNAVRALMLCIQNLRTEVCIRAVLSAVWNLSAHKSENKEEICRTPGSLKFLAFALSYRSPSKSIVVAENAGGILRNISSHIAVKPEYRKILRQEGCLRTLVSQLRSPSTRVVSNSCGVLWNLSARCVEDQEMLWDLGAVSILRTLIHSKHKSISASSSAALRNLLAVKPGSGTDSESHLSFNHQRSNSLPTRSKHGIKIDRNAKSPGSMRKYRIDRNDILNDSNVSSFSQYDQERSARNMISSENGLMNVGENSPPPYSDVIQQEVDPRHTQPQIHHHQHPHHRTPSDYNQQSDHYNEQFFFPSDSGHLPPSMNHRMHKRYDSTSSCSSFSPNENKTNRLPFIDTKPNESSESRSEIEEKMGKLELRSTEESEGKKTSDSDRTPREEKPVSDSSQPPPPPVQIANAAAAAAAVAINPYEDSKLSRVSDAVLIYVGTPKLPVKNLTKKEKKKSLTLTPKLTSKFKRNPLRKSKETLNSKDSLAIERSDAEKTLEKDNKKHSEDKKENIWMKTKDLKHRLLNKSHSSDLAFDKNVMVTTKRSPFDMYSMANFPDRVASDQCLTITDRMYRDNLMNTHRQQGDIHHGSWSSCDISQSREEKIALNIRSTGLAHTPQPIPKHSHDASTMKSSNQAMAQPLYSPQFGQEYYQNHSNFHPLNRPYHSNQNVYSTSHQTTGESHVESVSENEKTKTKTKKSLLKNPLRKSSDGSRKFLSSGKKTDKKGKKKNEDKN